VLRKKFSSEWAGSLNRIWRQRRDERDVKDEKTREKKRQFILLGEMNPRQIEEAVRLSDSQDDPLLDPRLDKPLDKMVNDVLAFANEQGGTVHAVTSRRTGWMATEVLKSAIGQSGMVHQWEAGKKKKSRHRNLKTHLAYPNLTYSGHN